MEKTIMIDDYIRNLHSTFLKIDHDAILKLFDEIDQRIDTSKCIFTAGNGGSAFTASHYITDWNKMLKLSKGNNLRGISLADNIGIITAFGNDEGYEKIFSGQLSALGQSGDLLIVISGSGNSKNIVHLLQTAKEMNVDTFGILGYDGGEVKALTDNHIHIPSFDMQICEDIHLSIGHMVMKHLVK
jgi:D-sedoheptulose 7-phosphate isomerase